MTSLNQLKRSTPEAEGISSSAVLNFIQALEQHSHPLDAVQGFMLLRHGNVAAEGWWKPSGPDVPHAMYSLSKSFTSTAIGLAVAEGLLSVDDPVLKFFPEDGPSKPSENLKAMRVRHLLSMNTGHHEDTTGQVFGGRLHIGMLGPRIRHGENVTGGILPDDENWARAFLALPVEHQPGTWFVYNTAATYMLSAIITRLTGESLLDYLRPRLFNPLGIEDPTWETDPRGINLGGTGLHIRTEDIARFGQMYLQKGMWEGRQIVPAAWIAEATKATSDNSNTQTNPDWTAGYGYQFWRCRHNAYRGDGAFGQYCIVMSEQDAVLTMISGVRDMQVVLNKVWEHLLPAMQTGLLPADPRAYDELCDKLSTLSLPLVQGQPSSPMAKQWSGKMFQLEKNALNLESMVIKFEEGHGSLSVHDERGEHQLQIGYSQWQRGITDMRGQRDEPIAASGAWTADDTYEVRICCYEDAFCPVLRFHFMSNKLQQEVEPNTSWDWDTSGLTKIAGRKAD